MYSFFLPVYCSLCMDKSGWGNTYLLEKQEKKVVMNNDEKFDDSTIPLEKFGGTSFPCLLVLLGIDQCTFRI